jgi:hypothetical protein
MNRLILIVALLFVTFAQSATPPSTGYATQGRTAVGTLTDFTVIVDLSDMPAAWWTANDTATGSKGRAFKDDGSTELASDWIDFDNGTETGQVRVLWSSTYSGSVDNDIRIYPPVAANSTYAAGDTYGSDNAYDSDWQAYWDEGGGTDRTSNGNDLIAQGSASAGNITGKVGKATDYISTGDYYLISSGFTPGDGAEYTLMAWGKTSNTSLKVLLGAGTSGSGSVYYWLGIASGGYGTFDIGSTIISESTTTMNDGTWNHIVGRSGSATDHELYINSVSKGTSSNNHTIDKDHFTIGRFYNISTYDWTEQVDEVQVHSADRGDDWIEEEYAATDDNSTYWGTWTWTPVASGGNAAWYYQMLRRRN